MEVGLLYEYDKKRYEQDVKNKVNVGLGLEVSQLFDYINYLEVINEGSTEKVLAEIKKVLMQVQGKINVEGDADDKPK